MFVKLKKKSSLPVYFVILLTFGIFISCKSKSYTITKAETSKISVDSTWMAKPELEAYIAPYRNHIEKDLDSVLSFNPETLDKSKGKWETNIGLFLAKSTFELSNPIFEKNYQKKIDLVLLNHGGIRSTISKGNVTARDAYNVMPFENSVIIVALKGYEIKELAKYILTEQKPHPMYGIKIFAYKDSKTTRKIEINNKPLLDEQTYYVATSDYLANGGDNMMFFKNSKEKIDLNYKLRNLLIDYFNKNKTIEHYSEKIVIEE